MCLLQRVLEKSHFWKLRFVEDKWGMVSEFKQNPHEGYKWQERVHYPLSLRSMPCQFQRHNWLVVALRTSLLRNTRALHLHLWRREWKEKAMPRATSRCCPGRTLGTSRKRSWRLLPGKTALLRCLIKAVVHRPYQVHETESYYPLLGNGVLNSVIQQNVLA